MCQKESKEVSRTELAGKKLLHPRAGHKKEQPFYCSHHFDLGPKALASTW